MIYWYIKEFQYYSAEKGYLHIHGMLESDTFIPNPFVHMLPVSIVSLLVRSVSGYILILYIYRI